MVEVAAPAVMRKRRREDSGFIGQDKVAAEFDVSAKHKVPHPYSRPSPPAHPFRKERGTDGAHKTGAVRGPRSRAGKSARSLYGVRDDDL
jgi:hypothetical protein